MGSVGGVPVYLKSSWFVVALIVTVLFAPTASTRMPDRSAAAAYVVAMLFALLLLLSVFIHELAHAAAARAAGTPVSHIVLDIWGGHTAFSQESSGPWRSIAIAAVGPLSNGAIAVVGYVIAEQAGNGVTGLLLTATWFSNAIVAGFNALPGLPLDGGRVLEGLVWSLTGDRPTGTLTAGWFGRAVAAGVALWVVLPWFAGGDRPLTTVIWVLLIAGLIWQGAGQAIALGRWGRRAGRASAQALLHPAVAVPSTATVAAARAATGRDPGEGDATAVVVLDVYGRPAAIVDEQAAAQVPPERLDAVPASAVAHALPSGAVVDAELAGPALLERMQGSPASRYAVVDGSGAVIGVLDWDDVARFVTHR